eukprot:712094_1
MRNFGSITVTDNGDVLVMRMHGGSKMQNVFNPPFAKQFINALDYVASVTGEKTLVLTGTDRFFSAGIDLKHIDGNLSNENGLIVSKMLSDIMIRLILLNMPTVAAINGHAFGAGFFLFMCCDYRIMKKNGGRLCVPAVKLNLSPNTAWTTLLKIKLNPKTLRTTMFTGKQWMSNEALEAELIDQEIDAHNSDIFTGRGVQFASSLSKFSKNRANYSRIKRDLYYKVID